MRPDPPTMELILVPTDFSEAAGHATDFAARLALRHGAELHLLHAVDVPEPWQDGRFTSAVLATKPVREQQALYPEARAAVGAARQRLEDLTRALAKRKVKASSELTPNAAWDDVLRIAKARRADLIVMGTHGAGAMREAFIGSNTQRLVRMANQPVITLHQPAPAKIANVAVLADPLEKGIEKAIERLIAPLSGEKCKFHLLYVNTPGFFQDTDTALEQLRSLEKKVSVPMTLNTTDHLTVVEGALSFARRAGMDMIAAATHGRSGLGAFINASVAEMLVNHSPVPVITARMG